MRDDPDYAGLWSCFLVLLGDLALFYAFFFPILRSPERARFGDRITGTRVVRIRGRRLA
jgi:hypothetical protein